MKNWIASVLALLALSHPTLAAFSEPDQASLGIIKNYAKNGGAEQSKAGWSVSGTSAAIANLAVDTTNKYEGNAGFAWTPANADNFLSNASITLVANQGLSGLSCAAVVYTKSASGAHAIEAYDGSSVLATATIAASTTFAATTLQWTCSASGTQRIRFNAGSTTVIYIDSLRWGSASYISAIAPGSIVDADVNAAAAIAGTKISPNFGSQNISTSGVYSSTSSAGTNTFAGTVQVTDGANDGSTELRLTPASTGQAKVMFGPSGTPDKGKIMYSDNADSLNFYTASTSRLVIDTAGTTTASGKLSSTLNGTGMSLAPTSGVSTSIMDFTNTGGRSRIGIEGSSAGGILGTASAYDFSIVSATGHNLGLGVDDGAVTGLRIATGTGGVTMPSTLSVTGQATFNKNSAAQAGFSGWSDAGANASNGQIAIGSNATIRYDASTNADLNFTNNTTAGSNGFGFFTNPGGVPTTALTIDGAGNTAISGTLAVTGTITGPLATASVDQAELAARATGVTVAAGGYAKSNIVTTNYTSTSGSMTTVTAQAGGDMSVTITTTGRPVFVGLTGDNSGNNSIGYTTVSSGTAAQANFQLVRDGSTVVVRTSVGGQATGINKMYVPPGSMWGIDVVAAGTYTYTLQVQHQFDETVSVQGVHIVAYEL